MDSSQAARVRQFCRIVTGVGARDAHPTPRSTGQARLLSEIGTEPVELRQLRARMGLDSGYLSRLLGTLQADGLVTVDRSGPDRRVRTAHLTALGRAELAALDQVSHELAASVLRPLDAAQRDRLLSAMAEVERLLAVSSIHCTLTDPDDPGARHCAAAFDAELTERLGDDAATLVAHNQAVRAPGGLTLLASVQGEPVGWAALRFDDTHADIVRLWLSPTLRRLGLGRRMLTELEQHARTRGVETVRVRAHRLLREAVTLLRSTGYVVTDPGTDLPRLAKNFVRPHTLH